MYSLAGGPGTGKTTQSTLLSNCGYAVVSAGKLVREKAPQHILDQMLVGDLVDHDYLNALIAQAVDDSTVSHGRSKIVIDGYPRALVQARWLLETYPDLKACLLLTASEQCIMKRLMERHRPDDQKMAVILRRLQVYEQNVGEVLNYYREQGVEIYEINAEQIVEEVFADIKEVLSRD